MSHKSLQRAVLTAIGCLAIVAPYAVAQQSDQERLEQSPRHHEWVEVKAGDRTVRSFLVYPEVDRAVPAVVVIHENRGLTDWVRAVADQLAEAGYVAIAPDLLSQTGPNGGGTESYASSDAAREGIYRLPAEQVLSDLNAVVRYVRQLDATTDTVAVAGFCWGGGQAFAYAAHNRDIAASFVFYGPAPDEEHLQEIDVPVYGFYGGQDARITAQVPRVKETLQEAGKKYEPVIYEGAGHGFMRAGAEPDAEPANRRAMQQGWQRWIEILKILR